MTVLIRAVCGTLLLLLLLSSGRVQAQESPDDATVSSRIAHVQAILDERTGRAGLWQYGFMGLGYAATGGFIALAATLDKEQRLDFAFAAGGAFIDTTVHVLSSINVHAAARVRDQPDASPEQRRVKLAMAEAELVATADSERDRRSLLKAQILPVGFSLLTGLVLAIGFDHIRGAIVNTAAAVVINELRVLLQPTSTISALEEYRRNPDALARPSASTRSAWLWTVSPLGCAVTATF
jgi:hypothetical protein